MRALTTCPECTAVRMEGSPCGQCGWQPRAKAKPVEVADGELAPIDRALRSRNYEWSSPEKATFHRMLLWIARKQGYQDGWAAYKFKEKFGCWPKDRSPEPEPPEPAVRSWVRSRMIAYSKAKQKRGAA